MRLLLDSHALVWVLMDSPRLAPGTAAQIEDRANDVSVSVASIWELAVKREAGRLDVPRDLAVRAAGRSTLLAITAAHAEAAAALPLIHRDPFDRMLVAQAQLEELVLVTADARVARYAVATMPAS